MEETKKSYYLVVGLGSSGLSMARFLHSIGRHVVATDIDESKPAAQRLLKDLGIRTQIGFHDQKTFDLATAIVVSPGIPLDMAYLKAAAQKGVPIMGELDIFSHYNKAPVIAITGTNGKTTTTTLIRDMLEASGLSTFMGGNIGTPLVEHLMAEQKADLIVAEISSFQLDLASNFKPEFALLLNVTEDHLDRYDGFDGYTESKWKIFKNQTSHDKAIINQAIEGFETRISRIASRIFSFSSRPESQTIQEGARICGDKIILMTQEGVHHIDTCSLTELPGIHNRENIAAAALASLLAGGNMAGILQALENFKNLPHRMAFVRKINGVDFYDDSKATNTDAVVRALESFQTPVILILGGREKGTDFSQLIPAIKQGVKQIIALGEAKDHIQKTLEKICSVVAVNSMKEAVEKACELAGKGEVVLLSPACASFDMYENYGARGDDFIALVRGLENGR
ncbi:MAG: UDP-N-acetylmuramoyl-L-alanine--D-glutamate ligase [Proteobacteria bacterium]|nr:UDP-N-acetylmuramoyl-L-alanine--D-glutamate ligase [Desulfobacula sp.]MBU4133129.1 UDP-N-acetylmuramoyl-L-alanine--D-glutamate ligase [Pseudomonadota bacterium]